VDVMGRAYAGKVASESRDPNLSEYAGKWVSLRRGVVVAVADSYDQLMDSPGRRRLDGALRVPPTANLAL